MHTRLSQALVFFLLYFAPDVRLFFYSPGDLVYASDQMRKYYWDIFRVHIPKKKYKGWLKKTKPSVQYVCNKIHPILRLKRLSFSWQNFADLFSSPVNH